MNITIVGHVCIDNNVSKNTTYTTAGSPAMFISKIYKKKPDVSTYIISPYGSDFVTYTKGISIFPHKPTNDLTLIYENNTSGVIRSQKAHNREYAKPLQIGSELKKIITESDILFFAPLTPDYSGEYVKNLMKSTRPDSLKILIPQGYCRSFDKDNNVIQRDFIEAQTLLSLFDFVIVSELDHENMKAIAQKWAEKTHIIMTLGDKGSSYIYKDEFILEPVEKVKREDIVDSVGSGDIFAASFGYKYYLIKDIKKSLSYANTIARQCLFYPATNLQFSTPN